MYYIRACIIGMYVYYYRGDIGGENVVIHNKADRMKQRNRVNRMNKIYESEERMSGPESINFQTKVLASRNTAEAHTRTRLHLIVYIYTPRRGDIIHIHSENERAGISIYTRRADFSLTCNLYPITHIYICNITNISSARVRGNGNFVDLCMSYVYA